MNKQKIRYSQEKKEEDFTKYYNITISVNAYIERLLDKVAREKGFNKSQCIRNLIYNEYQKMKENGFIS